MPNNLLGFTALLIAVVAAWALGVARLGLLTPADLRAWRRLAGLRGLSGPPSILERAADRISALRRVQDELDLDRLLAMAGREQTPAAFLAQTGVVAFVALGFGLISAVALQLVGSELQVTPAALVLIPLAAVLVQFTRLRRAARMRRQRAGRALGDMMMLVAVLTDGRGLQLDDAVQILARCARTSELESLVSGGWQRLLGPQRITVLDRYRLIGEHYGIPDFRAVADALANTHVGMPERDTYTRVAQSVYQQRLTEARQRAARARILVTLPVAGMLIPLLVLLGAPTFASLSSGLGH